VGATYDHDGLKIAIEPLPARLGSRWKLLHDQSDLPHLGKVCTCIQGLSNILLWVCMYLDKATYE